MSSGLEFETLEPGRELPPGLEEMTFPIYRPLLELAPVSRHPEQGDLRQVQPVEQGLIVGHRPCLVAKVKLFAELLAEAVELLQHRDRRLLSSGPHDKLQQRLQQVEVDRNPKLNTGAQHFDGDIVPVMGNSPMHHRDRGLADRC